MPSLNKEQWDRLRQAKQCWYCQHNYVSDLCADCLSSTVIFEKSDGVLGAFKPEYKEGLHCMRTGYKYEYEKKGSRMYIKDTN